MVIVSILYSLVMENWTDGKLKVIFLTCPVSKICKSSHIYFLSSISSEKFPFQMLNDICRIFKIIACLCCIYMLQWLYFFSTNWFTHFLIFEFEFDTFIMIDATTSTMLEPLPSISKIKLGLSWKETRFSDYTYMYL